MFYLIVPAQSDTILCNTTLARDSSLLQSSSSYSSAINWGVLICQMFRCKNLKSWDLLVIKTIYGHWRTDLIVPSDKAIWWLQNSRHPTEENITAGGATRGYKGWCMSRYCNLSLLCLPSLQRLHKCLHWRNGSVNGPPLAQREGPLAANKIP